MPSCCSDGLSRWTRRAGRGRAETIAGPVEVGYEQLVVALGAVTRTFPVPGLVEHARGFKDLADAIALRNHTLQRLEAATVGGADAEAELGFVFVGAGYAGVEALAELIDLVDASPGILAFPGSWASENVPGALSTGVSSYAPTVRSAAVSDWRSSSTGANRSPSRATRSSTSPIVKAPGSRPARTSSQRSGADTGAPARGRTE